MNPGSVGDSPADPGFHGFEMPKSPKQAPVCRLESAELPAGPGLHTKFHIPLLKCTKGGMQKCLSSSPGVPNLGYEKLVKGVRGIFGK